MANGDLSAFLSGTTDMSGVEIGAGGPRVRQTAGTVRRIMAGLPNQSVAAGASADLTINVSEPFKFERLVLSVAAQALNVTNVKVGLKSLNVSTNAISGNAFSEQAIGTTLDGYTAQAGVGFVVSVINPTGAAVLTGGGVFGPSLAP